MTKAINNEIVRLHDTGLLGPLLEDKTTGKNIIWATDAYQNFGDGYLRAQEITEDSLLCEPFRLMSRAEKDKSKQSERTKTHAEVFTPLWVVKKMNDYLDCEWFGYEGAFEEEKVTFPKEKTWQQYVDSRRMEITCGEAPFLVNRYDVETSEEIPLNKRSGLLDRKLRVVSENASNDSEWVTWALRAFESTYGYEFQGDNVLLARLNLLATVDDFMEYRLQRSPSPKEYQKFIRVIVWNIWQMDGLTGTIPYCDLKEKQLDMFSFDDDSGPTH